MHSSVPFVIVSNYQLPMVSNSVYRGATANFLEEIVNKKNMTQFNFNILYMLWIWIFKLNQVETNAVSISSSSRSYLSLLDDYGSNEKAGIGQGSRGFSYSSDSV